MPTLAEHTSESLSGVSITAGTCHAVFAFDLGRAIDLEGLERHIATLGQRERIRRTKRSPKYFAFEPPPLRITIPADPVEVGRFRSAGAVSCVVYEFGAVSVAFTIDLEGPLADLQSLSVELYDHEALHEAARHEVASLLETIQPFVAEPKLRDLIEDYFIFEVRSTEPPVRAAVFAKRQERWIAQVLRAESKPLSQQEVRESVGCQVAYGEDDLAIVDWNAAILFDPEAVDVLAVLEFANVELLELRYLDEQLDQVLEQAYHTLAQPRWPILRTRAKEMRQLATFQVESAMLFERINNALKLFGDQYLARVHRLSSERLHIGDWDASILRKLETADGIYSKISDYQATRRMEILEWIIILLIALSIIIGFLPW